jgi:hypothetical protein
MRIGHGITFYRCGHVHSQCRCPKHVDAQTVLHGIESHLSFDCPSCLTSSSPFRHDADSVACDTSAETRPPYRIAT